RFRWRSSTMSTALSPRSRSPHSWPSSPSSRSWQKASSNGGSAGSLRPQAQPIKAAGSGETLGEDAMMALDVRGISKRFGEFPALYDVHLKGEPGEFLALLGPSGSGKTTLLRMLAGLEIPDKGEIFFGGENLLAQPARERRIGMVFQHYALF